MKKNIKSYFIQLLVCITAFIILYVVVSCERKWKWDNKRFFIESLNLHIDIELIDSIKTDSAGTPLRIFLYDEAHNKGMDYIDIINDMTDMPSILLSLPKHQMDTIYVIDNWHEVQHIHSNRIKFVHLEYERLEKGKFITVEHFDKNNRIGDIMDSVTNKIPSTSIQLSSGFVYLSMWENGEYKGTVNTHYKK